MSEPFSFDPNAYGSAVAALVLPIRVAELGPGTPNAAARAALSAFDPSRDFAQPVRDREAAQACLAGLFLYHDFHDEAHAISQDLPTAEGSFWHAILHRREPDPSNSKYWWRQVGSHLVLSRLASETPALGYSYTSPTAFVDFCERVRGGGTSEEELAKRVQALEWQLLFEHCYRKTVG
ncbi:hypothetical protein [Fimbriiglobus ruber]|nr:hypothetical protein [Fimbriiglobus ruber]